MLILTLIFNKKFISKKIKLIINIFNTYGMFF